MHFSKEFYQTMNRYFSILRKYIRLKGYSSTDLIRLMYFDRKPDKGSRTKENYVGLSHEN